MCVTCGCGKYGEKHGDDRNITMAELREAAEAANISLDDVVKNIQESVSQSQSGTSA